MYFKNMTEERTKFNTQKATTEVRNWLTLLSFLKHLNLKRKTGFCFMKRFERDPVLPQQRTPFLKR